MVAGTRLLSGVSLLLFISCEATWPGGAKTRELTGRVEADPQAPDSSDARTSTKDPSYFPSASGADSASTKPSEDLDAVPGPAQSDLPRSLLGWNGLSHRVPPSIRLIEMD